MWWKQLRQVEIPGTKTATADTVTTSGRTEGEENTEYCNHLKINVEMASAGDLDTEMTVNDVYERGEQGGDGLYSESLQQPVTDSVTDDIRMLVHDDVNDVNESWFFKKAAWKR